MLPYLIYCNIVAWLLKARGIVISVPHNDPYLVENDSTNQQIGALDLHHNGADIVGGLRNREKTDMSFKYLFFTLSLWAVSTRLIQSC